MAARLATVPCASCGATIKRRGSWGSCSQCSERVFQSLRATVGTRDPSAWQRACSLTFGNREAFVAAAERAA